jgi:hypothetical protein
MPSPQESDAPSDAPRGPSGKAAYEKTLEAIAQRNAAAQKAGRQERQAFEQRKAALLAKAQRH